MAAETFCRLLFFSYLHFFGIDAFGWRAGIVLIHALSAIFLAILARRYAGSARAGITTPVIYVGACGFTSMWIWFPTGATVPLMMVALTGAALLLSKRDHLTLRRVAAGVAVILALLSESSFAPMALLPAVIDDTSAVVRDGTASACSPSSRSSASPLPQRSSRSFRATRTCDYRSIHGADFRAQRSSYLPRLSGFSFPRFP
ncbi:MAG TPA: hypothetical protein VMU84_00820 [Thermoanaerobaculia bacterium]|nr:hypothetical protein [Thermoanaerobaculia bacterium]